MRCGPCRDLPDTARPDSMTPTSRSRCRCLPGFSLATHGLALADLTGLLLTAIRSSRADSSPAGEEDGEQGQALHQPADVVQRPRVGEDQHDDDTRTPAARVLPTRGYQRGSREPVRQHDERHGSGGNRIGCQPCSGTWPASCTAEKALLHPAMPGCFRLLMITRSLNSHWGVAWLEEAETSATHPRGSRSSDNGPLSRVPVVASLAALPDAIIMYSLVMAVHGGRDGPGRLRRASLHLSRSTASRSSACIQAPSALVTRTCRTSR